jgi:hypothetical protein
VWLYVGLAKALGAGGMRASLRAQEYDIQTRVMTAGSPLSGGSIGVVSLLCMIQAMTECSFFDQVSEAPFPLLPSETWQQSHAECAVTDVEHRCHLIERPSL